MAVTSAAAPIAMCRMFIFGFPLLLDAVKLDGLESSNLLSRSKASSWQLPLAILDPRMHGIFNRFWLGCPLCRRTVCQLYGIDDACLCQHCARLWHASAVQERGRAEIPPCPQNSPKARRDAIAVHSVPATPALHALEDLQIRALQTRTLRHKIITSAQAAVDEWLAGLDAM
jgi:hypothetical protein